MSGFTIVSSALLGKRYCRPKTRGELRDKLAQGVTCEVVGDNALITSVLLKGWLRFDKFDVKRSKNSGWALFVPNAGGDCR
jgi:hypothetical protein